MAKYQIWDRTTNIQTPTILLTPEQFAERYAWVNAEGAIPVISVGVINGASIGELNNMRLQRERLGAIFADGLTNEELLEAIEAFDDAQASATTDTVSDETRIADALEDMVVLQEVAAMSAE